MHIVLSGPPGAGKSTTAKALAERTGALVVGTGALLRAEVAAGTELGGQVQAALARGERVADGLVLALVERQLRACGEQGFILDGFPLSIPQAVSLDFLLARLNLSLDLVADLVLAQGLREERLAHRRICADGGCQDIHNLLSRPPAAENRCRRCGQPVMARPDDSGPALALRLKLHREQSTPLLGHYQRKGLLLTVREVDSWAGSAQILGTVAAQGRILLR